jgi:DeoR/GlpR family transcriptional regulator of sugar metabolism
VSRILDLDRHDEPYVSVAELARYWGVSDDMIRRDIEKGALKVMVVGSSQVIRIPIAEARRYGRPRTHSKSK